MSKKPLDPQSQINEMMQKMRGANCCYSSDPIESLDELLNDRWRLLFPPKTGCSTCAEIISLLAKSYESGNHTITILPSKSELPSLVLKLLSEKLEPTKP